MAGGHQLSQSEHILRGKTQPNYSDINDILELYNIKKYFDNELYLKNWTQEDIVNFKQKVGEFGKAVGEFISNINDTNVIDLYPKLLGGYVSSFWEIVNNQKVFKRISKSNFNNILKSQPNLIYEILNHRGIVDYYNMEVKSFLLTYPKSAEILLSIYEEKEDFRKSQKFIPKSLTLHDKESIISNYLNSNRTNPNYIGLIKNVRNKSDFKISDKIRLKAKQLYKSETKKLLSENGGMEYGVSISFPENATKIKDTYTDKEFTIHHLYSLDYIKHNNRPYDLFLNFKYLFEYLDIQNRISLVNKKNQMEVFENIMGIRSQNEYRKGIQFSLSEMTSHIQILGYEKVVRMLNTSLEDILYFVFTTAFQKRYNFAENARFSIPSNTNSYLEKVRLLAPEFESILKQFKLYVEDGNIDFELLQISSSPVLIKDIPSLVPNKYIYFNEDNEEMLGCSNLFFSDQTLLTYIRPIKERKYSTFFDILKNESQVSFDNYEEYQRQPINYLIDKGLLSLDKSGLIKIANYNRVLILKDLYYNEVASFYHYPSELQKEVIQMASENILFFDSSLFSKPEQAYFNYFLNKSEFTNGLDLRNSYLHGTQANPEELKKHQNAYFTYLKLLVLTMLKIDNDLHISQVMKEKMLLHKHTKS